MTIEQHTKVNIDMTMCYLPLAVSEQNLNLRCRQRIEHFLVHPTAYEFTTLTFHLLCGCLQMPHRGWVDLLTHVYILYIYEDETLISWDQQAGGKKTNGPGGP